MKSKMLYELLVLLYAWQHVIEARNDALVPGEQDRVDGQNTR